LITGNGEQSPKIKYLEWIYLLYENEAIVNVSVEFIFEKQTHVEDLMSFEPD